MTQETRTLTDLESSVLGVVWQRGPCTAYAVRREFAISGSPHWSSSAGSIYPVLGRLERLGLIEAEELPWGGGTKKHYRPTAAGLKTLREWIGPPLEPWTVAPTFDPIRTRANFLGVLSPAARRRFFAEAQGMTREELKRHRSSELLKSTDPYERFAALGVIFELEGRLRWLAAVIKEIE